MTPFGPRLVGETEKTLDALLRRMLTGTAADEPRWVVLRLAASLDDGEDLATTAAELAHFENATELVTSLRTLGLIAEDGRPTTEGRALIAGVQERISAEAGDLWADLPPDDVAATERTLNTVIQRARAVLARP